MSHTHANKTARVNTTNGPHFLPHSTGSIANDKPQQPQITNGYSLKRAFDIILSLSLISLLSPILIGIALAVRLTSKGPVIYRQRRLGLHERPFWMMKFRSMCADAESRGPHFTANNDPRITRVGRILRKTSLDELPQLFNVLAGVMSMIGPRPYVGFELDEYTPEERALRASVRPGISGLAQVEGRSSFTQRESAAKDLEYVERCSLPVDIKLAFRTIGRVLGRGGTN